MYQRMVLAVLCSLAIGQVAVGASTTPAGTTPAPTTPPAGTGPTTPEPTFPPLGAPDENSCSDKKPCPDKNSKCLDGRCLCNEGYTPGGNDTCIKAPFVGEPCKVGNIQLGCQGFGTDALCPASGSCQCLPGYLKDKAACKPVVPKLGADCKANGDCTVAFSTCQSGKCACIDGFKEDSSLCKPKAYNCLNGDKPLEEKGSVRLCEVTWNAETAELGNDTCPSTHFCNIWQTTRTKQGNAAGHCCPKPPEDPKKTITGTCPIGVEHKTAKCVDTSSFPADKPLPVDLAKNQCPYGQYECVHNKFCCPTPCPFSNNFYNIDGKCYDIAISLDDTCEFDVQCFSGSTCTKGTCQCKSGYVKADTSCQPKSA